MVRDLLECYGYLIGVEWISRLWDKSHLMGLRDRNQRRKLRVSHKQSLEWKILTYVPGTVVLHLPCYPFPSYVTRLARVWLPRVNMM
jgi:hypothetical protein